MNQTVHSHVLWLLVPTFFDFIETALFATLSTVSSRASMMSVSHPDSSPTVGNDAECMLLKLAQHFNSLLQKK